MPIIDGEVEPGPSNKDAAFLHRGGTSGFNVQPRTTAQQFRKDAIVRFAKVSSDSNTSGEVRGQRGQDGKYGVKAAGRSSHGDHVANKVSGVRRLTRNGGLRPHITFLSGEA